MAAAKRSTFSNLFDAIDRVAPTLVEFRETSERERSMATPIATALHDEGFFRMFRPAELGGWELDPVSEWNFTIPWIATIDVPPNDLDEQLQGYSIGYCPHGQLPRRTLDPKASLDNHALDERAIMMWEEVFGASYCHPDAAACMKNGYDPLVLEYTG